MPRDPDYDQEPDSKLERASSLSVEENERLRNYVNKHPNHKYASLRTQLNFLNRFSEDSVKKLIRNAKGGLTTRQRKFEELHSRLRDQVNRERDELHQVSPFDISRYALEIAADIGLDKFSASPSWVSEWQKQNRIADRAITGYVSKRTSLIEEQKKDIAAEFTRKVEECNPVHE